MQVNFRVASMYRGSELGRAAKGKAETFEHLFTRPDLIRSKSGVTRFGVGHNAASAVKIGYFDNVRNKQNSLKIPVIHCGGSVVQRVSKCLTYSK